MKRLGYFLLISAVASISLTLSGCGQKGPLELPEEKPANQTDQDKQS